MQFSVYICLPFFYVCYPYKVIMKKLLIIMLLAGPANLFAQDSLNMELLYRWDDANVWESQKWGDIWQQYNEIWGYADESDGNEYAIIGSAAGTYIFNVTDPANTQMVDFKEGKDTAEIHRDFKTYGHYLYGVADEGESSLQIFDLSFLPDSMHKVYDSDQFVIRSHNMFIDSTNGRLYLCTPAIAFASSSLRVLDIATDPENPTLLGDLNLVSAQGSHVHDLFIRDNIAYCSNGHAGLFMFDVADPANITLKASLTSYADQDYNHSSWMSDDSQVLYFVDEKHGMGIKAYDVSDLNNLQPLNLFRSNVGSMPHNVFVQGNKLFVSYYHDGVWIFDITDPLNPTTIGYYDTFEEPNGYDSYQGCWGVYPYLPSGNILASDFSNGLFVLKDNSETVPVGIEATVSAKDNIVFPNPVLDKVIVHIPTELKNVTKISVVNLLGKEVYAETFSQNWRMVQLDLEHLKSGTYFLQIDGMNQRKTTRIVKH